MTEIGGVTGTDQANSGSGSTEPITYRPPIDTGLRQEPGTAPNPMLPLPKTPTNRDYRSAQGAFAIMSENVGVDFGHIAALMILIDSELSRAARDSQVMQIRMVAKRMHAIADDIRQSARLALAGGIVSGAAHIASAGISIIGGVKGMALTKTPTSVDHSLKSSTGATPTPNQPAPNAPPPNQPPPNQPPPTESRAAGPRTAESRAPEPPLDKTPPNAADDPPPANDLEPPAGAAEELPDQQTDTGYGGRDALSPEQGARATWLDHTLSQQLSARSQNVVLMTQGLTQLTTSLGDVIRTTLEHESRMTDAYVKDQEAGVEEQRAILDRTKGFADTMQKAAHDMLQIFQQMEEGIHQTRRAIWSRA